MQLRKYLRSFLFVITLVSISFGGWALGLNQLAQFVETKEQNDLQYWTGQCALLNVPHAILIEGDPYCYKTYQGSENVISYYDLLEILGVEEEEQSEGSNS